MFLYLCKRKILETNRIDLLKNIWRREGEKEKNLLRRIDRLIDRWIDDVSIVKQD